MSFIRMMVKGAKEESKSGFTVIKWGGEGDFIVISRTFFFYPNLVWISTFYSSKKTFLLQTASSSYFIFCRWRLQTSVRRECSHSHSVHQFDFRSGFFRMESIYLLWCRVNLDTPKLIQLMKYWVMWSWWTFSHRIDWPDTNCPLFMNWRVEAGC